MRTRFFTNHSEQTLFKKFQGVFESNPDIEWIDALVGYRKIELIREYRMRLVADVVTGPLDLRAAANLLAGTSTFESAPIADLLDEEVDLEETPT